MVLMHQYRHVVNQNRYHKTQTYTQSCSLFGPAMLAFTICANIVEAHFILSMSGLRLEEDSLATLAGGTYVVFSTRQCGINRNVRIDLSQLIDLMHDIVDIYTVVVGNLFIVAVATRVEQNPVVLVLLGIEHVVAFTTELDADKAGCTCSRGNRHANQQTLA